MKRYVTKNCIEKGIRHCDGYMESYPGWFYAKGIGSLRRTEHHETYEQAKEKADIMLKKRINDLEMKLAVLKEMKF